MRIRIDQPAAVRLELQPGDELVVKSLSPALDNLLTAERADGVKFAHLVEDDEDESQTSTVSARGETATTGRGRRDQRAAAVS